MARGLPYDAQAVEARWRERWDADGVARVDLDAVDADSKFYNLCEFPYPSAEGLHVGHVFKYSGVDVYGRFQRMRGRAVFQPMGWDSFGINAENYALRVGAHPRDLIGRTTERFRAQLQRGGMAWDWRQAIDTSSPSYYRWTQWLFVQLFDAGLAYQAEAPVLWCPSCLTVLAREQTEADGTRCERCGSEVGERVMRQWFLRITQYADRLLAGLDELDWPERAKRLQRQWIGRSEGREIAFARLDRPGGSVTAFTTRADTLPAVTFLAVPAGHEAAGGSARHPLTGAAVPIVAADYVVDDYRTGVVMGVPAHDERDGRFAARMGLSVSHAALLDDPSAVGVAAVRYRMRDWLISRQRYWGPPIPVVHCDVDGPVAVPIEELPVRLPDVEDVRPTGTGASPLAAVPEFVHTTCPRCGRAARRETEVADTFFDSSWYFLRYPSARETDRPWDPARTAAWLPVDFYAGGPEHVQRHHLYARFVTMALHDLGHVGFEEPFPRIRLGGLIVHRGAKMSKSRGNVVGPDAYWDAHGSDVLRCALLFSAPWQAGGDFRDDAIAGIERFFARVWRSVVAPGAGDDDCDSPEEHALPEEVAQTIGDVTREIERLRFNVALARLMELTARVRSTHGRRTLVLLLAPFAPHLAEELWARLGGEYSVHQQPWPVADTQARPVDDVEIAVQVDGRVRGRLRVSTDADERSVCAAALEHYDVGRALGGRVVTRTVYVPGRVVNLVTGGSRGV
jgi:leucyl-tRNA synthetase